MFFTLEAGICRIVKHLYTAYILRQKPTHLGGAGRLVIDEKRNIVVGCCLDSAFHPINVQPRYRHHIKKRKAVGGHLARLLVGHKDHAFARDVLGLTLHHDFLQCLSDHCIDGFLFDVQ